MVSPPAFLTLPVLAFFTGPPDSDEGPGGMGDDLCFTFGTGVTRRATVGRVAEGEGTSSGERLRFRDGDS